MSTQFNKYEKKIVDLLAEKGPLKLIEIPTLLIDKETSKKEKLDIIDNIMPVLEDMIQQKKIPSISYILPTMNYREKTLVFPLGTLFPGMESKPSVVCHNSTITMSDLAKEYT